MRAGPEQRTNRLRMRRWLPEDRLQFAQLNRDAEVMEYMPSSLTPEHSDAMVERIEAAFNERGFGLWAIEVPSVAPFIGFIGLSVPRFEAHFTPAVEIGWRLARPFWGRGYATEGAIAALEFGFSALDLSEIVSFAAVGNVRSRAVMERIGMTHGPADDFRHPSFPDGHALQQHVLYRIGRTAAAQGHAPD